ncbi:TetR/AcrR family transcriptional regulator [Dietzia maris]|uniref:TetR/AcrR family transcriptional regulator n=1 Tax=Dietzia maris TaxID=37915 RepID=UPI00232C7F0B|nr:TetR/AcrR family transcriptional regulator [Dietzia maris]
MTQQTQPGRPRNVSTDDAILEAAALRLSRDGYERTSIDLVARDAGVTRPTVYRRWPSKDELVIAAVAKQIKGSHHEPTGDLRRDLMDQAESLVERWSSNRYIGMLGTAIVERRHHPAIYEQLLEKLVEPRRRQMRDILLTAQSNGQARPDLDIEVIVAMFVGSFYAMTIAGRWEEGENWATRLTDTILAVVAPPESPHE